MTTAQRVYLLLENESLWESALRCQQILANSKIDHAICGGVAVCLHGYQRNTTDLDLIIQRSDAEAVKRLLESVGFKWDEAKREFLSTSGIAIQFLLAGERAGKGAEVTIPQPVGELNVEEREGLCVVKLSRLIEMKLASGQGNMRRTHKDFADIVELIAIRKLDSSFARYLHSSVRDTYRQLVRNASADE